MQTADHLPQQPAFIEHPEHKPVRFSLRTLILATLMVALALGLVVQLYKRFQYREYHLRTIRDLHSVLAAADRYHARFGTYPTSSGTLLDLQYVQTLNTDLAIAAPLHATGNQYLLDGWGQPFHLRVNGVKFWVWSCGPNGIDENGQGDDITLQSGD